MPVYEPFPGLDAWAKVQIRSAAQAEIEELLSTLRGASAEAQNAATEWILRAAAVDTGALEGLYPTDRGFTQSVAASGAGLESVLSNRPEAADFIRDQLAGFQFVLDMVTESRPFTAQAIRQLHEVLTRSQPTYTVRTTQGFEQRPLAHGDYKEQPNNPTRADGTVFAYAEPMDVPAEVQRLVDLTRRSEFASWSAPIQAAFVHYAFVRVHPFPDGNGRVARALASWPIYRAMSCPLLIFADQRGRYLDALEAADRGDLQALADFLVDAVVTGLRMLAEQVSLATLPSVEASLDRLRQIRAQGGGITDASLRTIAAVLESAIERMLAEEAPEEGDLLSSQQFRTGSSSLEPGWQTNGSSPGIILHSDLVDQSRQLQFDVTFRGRARPEAPLRVRCGVHELLITAAEVHPEISHALEFRLRTFLRTNINREVAAIAAATVGTLGRPD